MALSGICLPDTIVVAAPLVRKRDWITTLTCYRELRFRVTRYVSRDESGCAKYVVALSYIELKW